MIKGKPLAQRIAETFLAHFSHEGIFEVDLLNEEQGEAVRIFLVEAGCVVVKYDHKNRLNVVAPRRRLA